MTAHDVVCVIVAIICGSLALLSFNFRSRQGDGINPDPQQNLHDRRPTILLHANGGSLALLSLPPHHRKDDAEKRNDSRPMILLHAKDILALAPLSLDMTDAERWRIVIRPMVMMHCCKHVID